MEKVNESLKGQLLMKQKEFNSVVESKDIKMEKTRTGLERELSRIKADFDKAVKGWEKEREKKMSETTSRSRKRKKK